LLTATYGAGSIITNSNFSGTGNPRIFLDGVTGPITISYNTFSSSGTVVNGVQTSDGGSNITIDHNTFNGPGAGGIYIGITTGTTSVTITHNLVQGVSGHGIEYINGSTGTCSYNAVIGCGTKTVTNAGIGYVLHNTAVVTYNYDIAANNISGGFASLETAQATLNNCIFYKNGGRFSLEGGGNLDSIRAGVYSSSTGTSTMTNCIVKENYPYQIAFNCKANWMESYNLYQSDNTSPELAFGNDGSSTRTFAYWIANYEASSIYNTPGDLSFITLPAPSATSLASTDLFPTGISPAINAGTNVSLTPDFDGVTVPQGGVPDIGSFESKWCRWGANGVFGLTRWGVAGY
jgi:hypothetical protein